VEFVQKPNENITCDIDDERMGQELQLHCTTMKLVEEIM